MKRGLLLILITIFLSNFTNAQQVNENFETVVVENDISISGWLNHNQTGTRKWIGKEYSSNHYAQMSSYNSGEENVAYLITPELNITGASETFSFNVNIGYWKHVALTVLISTNFDGTAGGITTATWTDITSNFTIPQTPTSGYGTFATAGSMDISSYTGDAYIAFKYTGNANNNQTTTIQVDNVVVTGTAGIYNLSHNLHITPNPVNSVLNINSVSNINQISVSNIIGQNVMNVNNINSNNYSLNVNSLKNGIYMIAVKNSDGTYSLTKFIKE